MKKECLIKLLKYYTGETEEDLKKRFKNNLSERKLINYLMKVIYENEDNYQDFFGGE